MDGEAIDHQRLKEETMTKCVISSTALAAVVLGATLQCAEAQTYTVLHAFTGADGGSPEQGVVLDKQGNIYGTTVAGGASNGGTLFKTDPAGNLSVLYQFNVASGFTPGGAGFKGFLALEGDTLFGTTINGGGASYCGTAYSIVTDGSAYTVLHAFDGADGCTPSTTLQRVPGRGFVGATSGGGMGFRPGFNQSGYGILYALTRSGRYTILHKFSGTTDGISPSAVLTDSLGNVFGSTTQGGACQTSTKGCGLIYEYNLATRAYTVLYSFTGQQDGGGPALGSIGADGTLYGTTFYGKGPAHFGTLFALKPAGGAYTLDTLADFNAFTNIPSGGPTLTPQNALIGVAGGGVLYGYDGGKLTVLQTFLTQATGEVPSAQPAVAPGGTIIGTTTQGGVPACVYPQLGNSCGVLYRYTVR